MVTALAALSAGATPRGGYQSQQGPLTADPRDRDGTVVSATQSAAAAPRQAELSGAVATFTAAALQALQDGEALQPEDNRKPGQSPRQPSDPSSGDADTGQASAQAEAPPQDARANASAAASSGESDAAASEEEDPDQDGLTEEEEDQVEKLKQRDREVRAHEQAHARVGGPYAGAPSYTFQQGPDGGSYAIGGEVQIDTSPESEPEATVRKMQIVIRAALAPAEPSSQDLRVAQLARSQLQEAQSQARAEAAAELRGEEGEGEGVAQTSQTSATAPADKSEPSGSRQSSNEDNERSADAENRPTSDAAGRRSQETASAYRQAADRLAEAGRLAAGTGIFA
ncbi:putative metalloprotease CJM1_0395 family protein [Pannonibacter carbonis]|uniref:putative metalloprotease CJM1_0395 family protein n=1 Tax=Pannonibacter carbonis TaxID=2067569 RepID=UPI000D0E8F67|nr:putative metalloprotease CJM1_0395 family protein [Pannonibacter carbonis]